MGLLLLCSEVAHPGTTRVPIPSATGVPKLSKNFSLLSTPGHLDGIVGVDIRHHEFGNHLAVDHDALVAPNWQWLVRVSGPALGETPPVQEDRIKHVTVNTSSL